MNQGLEVHRPGLLCPPKAQGQNPDQGGCKTFHGADLRTIPVMTVIIDRSDKEPRTGVIAKITLQRRAQQKARADLSRRGLLSVHEGFAY
ncbi:hypothetical protein GCM10010961_20670 [Pseudodonghicola xiamenensis]|uniref:Uncharacterized protein n=1 Tax=Pseudodonghicola xiamenensis TaxID=337702 RepID=A0A8J3H7H1_9RHOB|nr:hypothetical protein GCM10010961_20670 [Pseudodonghicola xiamenensis]